MRNGVFDFRGIGHIEFSITLTNNYEVPSIGKCLFSFIARFIYYLFINRDTKYPTESELLFVSQSVNNERTLTPIIKYIKKNCSSLIRISDFPSTYIYYYSFVKLHHFIFFYHQCNSDERRRIRGIFHDFVLAEGYYKVYEFFFRHCKELRTIVVANDHSIPMRALIEAAHAAKITVVYTQHASVTDKFPPLHFNYSFLDGFESFEKYRDIGDLQGKVILLGSPRFDNVLKLRKVLNCRNSNNKAVGVALNLMDSYEKALQLCVHILKYSGRPVIVRPHPRSMDTFNVDKFIQYGMDISDSREESSYQFFTRVGIIVANESGIHLDAAIFGVPSILYNISDNPIRDWYGYLKKGLINMADSYDQVISLLNNPQPVSDDKIQYYYSAYNTIYDGHIAETIASFLETASNEETANCFLNEHFANNGNIFYTIK